MPSSDVSVVIPAYNAEKYIVEALNSISRQTTFPKEVIVINDGSSDDTYPVILSWVLKNPSPYPVHVFTQQNRGIPAARNVGIEHATGKWIALLDADDIWESNHLTELINAIALHPEAIAAYGAGRLLVEDALTELLYDDFWDNPSKKYGKKIRATNCLLIDRKIFPRLVNGNFIKPSSLMFLRYIADELVLFNESLQSAEDREFLARLVCKGIFIYSSVPITRYRWHTENATQTKNAKRNIENALRAIKLIRDENNLDLDSNELLACNEEVKNTARNYLYICCQEGLRRYLRGLYFLVLLFDPGVGLVAFNIKHIVRSVLPRVDVST